MRTPFYTLLAVIPVKLRFDYSRADRFSQLKILLAQRLPQFAAAILERVQVGAFVIVLANGGVSPTTRAIAFSKNVQF
ncbi:MAG: hypothetical protein ACOYL5_00365 [Phototrophicaceae bacterium]|jgi:hypothetical protein